MRIVRFIALLTALLMISTSAMAARPISATEAIPNTVTPTFTDAQSNANQVSRLLDDSADTVYSYIGWNSKSTDDIPELSFYFNDATISAVWMRIGDQSSSENYWNKARPSKVRLRLYFGNTYQDVTYSVEDRFDLTTVNDEWNCGYQLFPLASTISHVTCVDVFISGWYKGSVDRNIICLSDVQFTGSGHATPVYTPVPTRPQTTGGSVQPVVTATPVPPQPSPDGVDATVKRAAAAYSGPSTIYMNMGFTIPAGQRVHVYSAAYDDSASCWWAQVSYTVDGQLCRAYVDFASLDVNPAAVMTESVMYQTVLTCNIMPVYGPGADYLSGSNLLTNGLTGTVYAWENDFAQFDCFDPDLYQYRRVWVPMDAIQ